VPWDFGQSVTERAASLDVTSAPLRTEGPSSTRQKRKKFVHARIVSGFHRPVPSGELYPRREFCAQAKNR